ncbi:MAG: hypothetical protein J6A95_05880 [Clostridia bacterium]|nr:hypothetical protein [Clostridia bacterium]
MALINSIFADNMIMQANKPVRFFGEFEGLVTVCFNGNKKSVNSGGNWLIEFDPVDYGGPYSIEVSFEDISASIDGVYFGDVYLLGGQSNMQFKLWESSEPKENYRGNKNVRLFTVDRMEDGEHFKERDGWVELTKENAPNFSAIGYYVAQELARDDRKIGLIACYQGASVIQSWMSKEYALLPEFEIENRFGDHEWHPIWNSDGVLYENMLSKILPYSIASVLWYQGESNASVDESNIYLEFLRALITNWREGFKDDKLEFIIIQLADHLDRAGYAWSKIQEQQLLAQDKIPYVKTVVCRDVCDNIDIHPKEKDILSKRIANLL